MDYSIEILDISTSTNVTFVLFHVYSILKRSSKEQIIAYDWSSWCMGPWMTTYTLVEVFICTTYLLDMYVCCTFV